MPCFLCTVVGSRGVQGSPGRRDCPFLSPPPPSRCSLHSSISRSPVFTHARLVPASGPLHPLCPTPLSLGPCCKSAHRPQPPAASLAPFCCSLLQFRSWLLPRAQGDSVPCPHLAMRGWQQHLSLRLTFHAPPCLHVCVRFLLLAGTPGFWSRAHPNGLIFTNDICRDPISK